MGRISALGSPRPPNSPGPLPLTQACTVLASFLPAPWGVWQALGGGCVEGAVPRSHPWLGSVPRQPPSLIPDRSSHDSASAQEWAASSWDFLDRAGRCGLWKISGGEARVQAAAAGWPAWGVLRLGRWVQSPPPGLSRAAGGSPAV